MRAIDDTRIVERELLHHEEALGAGDPEAYRELLADPATFLLPGARLDRRACIAAIDATEPWDEFSIAETSMQRLGDDVAILTYRWASRRGEQHYRALVASTYLRTAGGWRLALHQQTPEPATP